MSAKIVKATQKDLQQILQLQYFLYKSEAEILKTNNIPPLKPTIDEWLKNIIIGVILKLVNESNEIIGSVRAREDNETVYISKLMVHPDYRKNGYGTMLLK